MPEHIRLRFEHDIDKPFAGLESYLTSLEWGSLFLARREGAPNEDVVAQALQPYTYS